MILLPHTLDAVKSRVRADDVDVFESPEQHYEEIGRLKRRQPESVH